MASGHVVISLRAASSFHAFKSESFGRIGRTGFLSLRCCFDTSPSSAAPLKVSGAIPSSFSYVMENPPPNYRRNVGICLINPSKKIFAASRIDIPDSWQMPQGGIDEGEDTRAAALRELREETGVHSTEFLAELPDWLSYDFPQVVRDKLNREWGSDWKGQTQKWFLFKFTGEDTEIDLMSDEKPEYKEWAWLSPEEVIDCAVAFKRPVYEQVMEYFRVHVNTICH